MFDIQEELKKLPDSPGVYLMKNVEGLIIYIGKAISLKNRVRQYFQSSVNHSPKVIVMVSKILSFDIIVTDSELEALILECNLIKKHKPYYNVLLKDDKHYPYIKVTINEPYPRIIFTRKIEKDSSKYFGPYSSAFAVRNTLDLLKKLFSIRTCTKKVFDGKHGRPCLNFHIGQCLGPCKGDVSEEIYKNEVRKVIDFLNGSYGEILEELTAKMLTASESMQFEKAKEYRDTIFSIKQIWERQKVFSTAQEDQDVISFATNNIQSCIQMFFIRSGRLVGKENFFLGNTDSPAEAVSAFIKQYYNEGVFIPPTIMVQELPEDSNVLQMYLSNIRGSKVTIKCPVRGQKHQLMEMAEKNVYLVLEQHKRQVDSERDWIDGSLEKLAAVSELGNLPMKIEAYDVSNTGGTEIVASMVVFENGRKSPSKYKRFKMKAVESQNDYQSLQEVLFRRLRHGLREIEEGIEKKNLSSFPDIIFVDGGIGHVNSALEVMNEIGIKIPILGMVKDDKHKTRGIVFNGKVADIKDDINLLRFVTMIQDEAHRFAIQFNRNLREKRHKSSEIDNIQGIGEAKRRLLFKHFKSIAAIKSAELKELYDLKGLGKPAAEAVYKYYH